MDIGNEHSESKPTLENEVKVDPSGFAYRGLYRIGAVPPCVLSRDDLRDIYRRLEQRACEALRDYVGTWYPDGIPKEMENLERTCALSIIVIGENGDQIVDTKIDALSDEALPARIISATFDSGIALDSVLALHSRNAGALNRFRLHLDFTDPPGLHMYDPWSTPTPNQSSFEIQGPNSNWVNGVNDTIRTFFRYRKRFRGWLHSHVTFNLLNWLIGFPVALWLGYRTDGLVIRKLDALPGALRGAMDIYLVLLFLLGFRLLVWAFRRLYPLVEMQGSSTSRVRTILIAASVPVLLGVLSDIIVTLIGFWK